MTNTIVPERFFVEREFRRWHPDMMASKIARLIPYLAVSKYADDQKNVEDSRFDITLQLLKGKSSSLWEPVPLHVNVGGQVSIPSSINLQDVVREATEQVFEEGGFFLSDRFSQRELRYTTEGITINQDVTQQSSCIGEQVKKNQWGDGATVHGYSFNGGYGIEGVFTPVAWAQRIGDLVFAAYESGDIQEIRPDGKVRILVQNIDGNLTPERVSVAVAHKKGELSTVQGALREYLLAELPEEFEITDNNLRINPNGEFHEFGVYADAGNAAKKDHQTHYGGARFLGGGTDGFSGKGFHKAAPLLFFYTRFLAEQIGIATQANLVSVGAGTDFGDQELVFESPYIEGATPEVYQHIIESLDGMPRNVEGIRELLQTGPTVEGYRQIAQFENLYSGGKWRREDPDVQAVFTQYVT